MTKFFKSTLSFGILIVAVLTVQNFILTRNINPFWGRKKLVASMDSLKSRNSYDMIFIGSSLTYRQINPTIIDSLLDIRSFNLGFPSMRNPELWYVVDHFIQEIPTSQRPKYLVIELSKIHEINSKNLNSVWSSYFLDYQRVRISTKYFSEKKDFTSVKNYFYDFLK
ncbi:MAG: hypothetical protein GY816_20025, partial [Cytophagales bacterium]|nr:hypothetical protein [Cytophagales bacterium]